MSGGDYERWVFALRAWSDDPSTDLSGLPPLTVESFSPSTYARLLGHLQKAIQAVSDRWVQRLGAAFEQSAGDPYAVARAMVEQRAGLGRRLQIARHPGWPAEIATELERGAADDIRRLQSELETAVTNNTATVDREHRERMIAIVRDNRFTALLDPGFDLGRLFRVGVSVDEEARAARAAEQPVDPAPSPVASPVARRIVVIEP